MTKEEIYQKAREINDRKLQDRLHIRECVEANICPECGEELKTYEDDDLNDITECTINNEHFRQVKFFRD